MLFIFKRLALFMSIAAAFAADNASISPAPDVNYARKQTNDSVTIAANPFVSGEKVKTAFGKLDPYQYGVLPVLVVIQNDGKETIRLDRLKVEYVAPGHQRVDATASRDVRYARGPQRPNVTPGPGGKVAIKSKKNPLDAWEIDGR